MHVDIEQLFRQVQGQKELLEKQASCTSLLTRDVAAHEADIRSLRGASSRQAESIAEIISQNNADIIRLMNAGNTTETELNRKLQHALTEQNSVLSDYIARMEQLERPMTGDTVRLIAEEVVAERITCTDATIIGATHAAIASICTRLGAIESDFVSLDELEELKQELHGFVRASTRTNSIHTNSMDRLDAIEAAMRPLSKLDQEVTNLVSSFTKGHTALRDSIRTTDANVYQVNLTSQEALSLAQAATDEVASWPVGQAQLEQQVARITNAVDSLMDSTAKKFETVDDNLSRQARVITGKWETTDTIFKNHGALLEQLVSVINKPQKVQGAPEERELFSHINKLSHSVDAVRKMQDDFAVKLANFERETDTLSKCVLNYRIEAQSTEDKVKNFDPAAVRIMSDASALRKRLEKLEADVSLLPTAESVAELEESISGWDERIDNINLVAADARSTSHANSAEVEALNKQVAETFVELKTANLAEIEGRELARDKESHISQALGAFVSACNEKLAYLHSDLRSIQSRLDSMTKSAAHGTEFDRKLRDDLNASIEQLTKDVSASLTNIARGLNPHATPVTLKFAKVT